MLYHLNTSLVVWRWILLISCKVVSTCWTRWPHLLFKHFCYSSLTMVFSSSAWMNAVTFWNLFTFDALFSLRKTKMLLVTNSLNEFGTELVTYSIWSRISLQEVPYEFIHHPWILTFIFQVICIEFHLFNVLEHPNKYINRS